MNIFFSTRRGKWGLFFVVIGIIGIFSDPLGSLAPISLGLILLIPEIIYLATPAENWWANWNESLNSNAQKTRLQRAISGDLTPKQVDVKFKNAIFVGSEGGKYFTTLKKCTCPDFQKRGVPCKHMFYLANELHLLDLSQSDWDEV